MNCSHRRWSEWLWFCTEVRGRECLGCGKREVWVLEGASPESSEWREATEWEVGQAAGREVSQGRRPTPEVGLTDRSVPASPSWQEVPLWGDLEEASGGIHGNAGDLE